MTKKSKFAGVTISVALLAALDVICIVAFDVAFTAPAQAQRYYYDDRYPSRPRPHSGGGFFDRLFAPFEPGPRYNERPQAPPPPPAPADYSHAPSPKKVDTAPTTKILVLGDGMADWLAYGLENAFADTPQVGIVRKNRARSGLIRYESRSDLEWPDVARDALANENPNYVVVMLGVSDRQSIHETDAEREAEEKESENKDQNAASESTAAPAHKPAKGVIEFRSDRWEKIYTKRIDKMIAALKSKGVPVFWVGLPAIRGTKSTADTVYLNDLYRSRAERAGVTYVDVWDGFVDDAGKFTLHGPDYEGQTRRLRSYDGVYFTTYGAIKLAHYVARDLRRAMNNRAIPVALPSGGEVGPRVPHARPLAGPVVPLTGATGNSDELVSAGNRSTDPAAAPVLVKGEPVPAVPGRADDFAWPRGSDAKSKMRSDAAPAAAAPTQTPKTATAPAIKSSVPNDTAGKNRSLSPSKPATIPARSPNVAKPADAAAAHSVPPERKSAPRPKAAPSTHEKTQRTAREIKPKQPAASRDDAPRPPAPIGGGSGARNSGGGLFGIFR